MESLVEGLLLRATVLSVVLMCDTEPRNCKECRELCSPLPVAECIAFPNQMVKCLCDGREPQQKPSPKK